MPEKKNMSFISDFYMRMCIHTNAHVCATKNTLSPEIYRQQLLCCSYYVSGFLFIIVFCKSCIIFLDSFYNSSIIFWGKHREGKLCKVCNCFIIISCQFIYLYFILIQNKILVDTHFQIQRCFPEKLKSIASDYFSTSTKYQKQLPLREAFSSNHTKTVGTNN